jgi:hypothetical protein
MVFFSLANDDYAIHADGAQRKSHGINGSLVYQFFVTHTHVAGSGKGRDLGNSHQFHGNVAPDWFVRRSPDHIGTSYEVGMYIILAPGY